MMTVLGGPPPPPPRTTPGSAVLADRVEMLLARVATLEQDQMTMDHTIERLQAQVEALESERKWWRRWHIKWGPFFRAWRDGTPAPAP